MLAARMNLKRQYQAVDDIPAEARGFYSERDGAWCLNLVEADREEAETHERAGRGMVPLTPALSPGGSEGGSLPREKRTFRDEMEARAAGEAMLRLEAEVRSLAQEFGATRAGVAELVQRARIGFRVLDGRACAVGSDGKTKLQRADGSGALSVAEWVRRQAKASPELFETPTRGDGYVEPELPARNPFKKRFWNLTEQMRLRKADPERAARLKREAWDEEG
jgi:hypothetical protein